MNKKTLTEHLGCLGGLFLARREYLLYTHSYIMVFHMKTTLIIDDDVMIRVKEEAVRRKSTISQLVEAVLRLLLDHQPEKLSADPPPLPSF